MYIITLNEHDGSTLFFAGRETDTDDEKWTTEKSDAFRFASDTHARFEAQFLKRYSDVVEDYETHDE